MIFNNVKNTLKRFFLNSFCLDCKTSNTYPFYHICANCIPKLQLVQNQKNVCPLCHDSWIIDNICTNCHNNTPEWDKLHTIFTYKSYIKNLFQLYKFQNSILAEKDLVQLLRPYIIPFSDYHIIITPCSKKTKKRLGFNPVTNIIKQITSDYSEPFTDHSHPMMKNLNRSQRIKQKSSMSIDQSLLPKNQKVLLVDDIFTTGSTLSTSTKLLKKHCELPIETMCFFRS